MCRNMKRILYIFIIAAASSFLFSCSLDETNYVEIQKDTYINDASEAETILLGIYRNMVTDGLYGYHLSLFFTLGTDEAKVEGNSLTNYRNVPNNAYTSTEDEVQATWKALYKAIYEANDFIERLSVRSSEFSEDDQRLAAVYMAEARSLRALFYFELVRWFGNVPLMTSTEQSKQHPSTFVQALPTDVYSFIEQELLYAVDVLPYAVDDVYRESNSFRISKGGALGLLAKVYATWAGYPLYDESKWEQAAKTAQVLIMSGKHGLLEDFETLWYNSGAGTWDPRESLIEVSFYSPTITGNSSNDSSGRIGKWNGVSAAAEAVNCGRIAANWKVLPTFALEWYESGYPNDKRWAVSCADHKYTADAGKTALWTYKENNVTKQGYWALAADPSAKADYRKNYNNNMCPGKWDIPKYVSEDNNIVDANLSNVNWYILRYADVLLLYAEALNEWKKGPSSEAFAAVNAVRRRGYGLPVSTSSSVADLDSSLGYEQFRQAVRLERAHELAFEGHRRQDLVRWGNYYETIQQTFDALAEWHDQSQEYYKLAQYTTMKGKYELLPIPQRDKDLCPLFKQNPGW